MDITEAEINAPWGIISVKLWGDADDPAILTIHGIMDNAGSFDGIIPLLPQNYFYICVDLPGHGKSSHFPPHLPIHTIDYIIVYKLVMDYFKREQYIIMAHSYGGQIGYLYAQLYPEKIEKLIMFDTVHMLPVPSNHFKHYLEDKFFNYFKMEEKKQLSNAPQYTYEEAFNRVMMIFFNLLIIVTVTMISSATVIDAGATLVGPSEPGTLLKGPSSKASVKGPSGLKIVSAGETGAIVSGAKSGGIVSASVQSPGVIASTLPLAPTPIHPIQPIGVPELYAQAAGPYPLSQGFIDKAIY